MKKTNYPLELSKRYRSALRKLLETPRSRGVMAARALGRQAMAAGCEVLALAQMHEQALIALAPDYDFAKSSNGILLRTARFFAEVLMPLENHHNALRESLEQIEQRAQTLQLHTKELAKVNRQLKRQIQRRQTSEETLKKANTRYQKLLAHSQLMQAKLRSLARKILSAQEDERREISRDLHDEVVQTLVGINVELAALGRVATPGTKTFQQKIAHTQHLVEKSVSAVHQFARDLRPAALDDLGLIPALQALFKTVVARKKMRIRLTAFAGVEALDSNKRIVLYRVAQEALNNVTRHARASLVDVSIIQIPKTIRLTIHDNGRSFKVQRVLSAKTNKRLGLLGMRERVEMVGGTLLIESAPEAGTTIRVEVPFKPKKTT